jgi:hypothetical protein
MPIVTFPIKTYWIQDDGLTLGKPISIILGTTNVSIPLKAGMDADEAVRELFEIIEEKLRLNRLPGNFTENGNYNYSLCVFTLPEKFGNIEITFRIPENCPPEYFDMPIKINKLGHA